MTEKKQSIEEFIKLWSPHFEGELQTRDNEMIVFFKYESFGNFDIVRGARDDAKMLGGRLIISPRPCISFPANILPHNLSSMTAVPLSTDTFHAERLRTYYSTTQDQLRESTFFLLSKGWNEKQFGELGVSHATFYRYLAEYRKSQADTKTAQGEKSTDYTEK